MCGVAMWPRYGSVVRLPPHLDIRPAPCNSNSGTCFMLLLVKAAAELQIRNSWGRHTHARTLTTAVKPYS
jgi:hypothetical protein